MERYALVLTFCLFLGACQLEESILIDTGTEKVRVLVKIADTPVARAEGLMFRESLEENRGMLFIFEEEDYRSFWMKNTLIPLDMIFIAVDGTVVDIKKAVPCEEDPCPSYVSTEPAQYVLEVNSGFAQEHGIAAGAKVLLD